MDEIDKKFNKVGKVLLVNDDGIEIYSRRNF